MEAYIFIGDGFLAEMGIQPLFAPLTRTGSVSFDRVKNLLGYIGKLSSVRVVDDAGLFYYRIYKDDTIEVTGGSAKTVKIDDLLASATKVDRDICGFIRMFPVIQYNYMGKVSATLPIIVKYNNSFWEHFSLAPIKMIKDEAEYYIYGNAIGIIIVNKDTAPKRPYIRDVLRKPTSTLLSEECSINLLPPKQTKVETDKKKGGISELG